VTTIRHVGPHAVMRALSCGRAAAYAVMQRLGGQKVAGVGWRLSERRLLEYLRRLERGENAWTRNSRSSGAEATGTATSEHQTAGDTSAPCISETTEAPQATEPPSPPTGKSRHEQRLARMIAQLEGESRSAKRSKRTEPHKSSPA
jgi:hypothetical protein